MIICVCVYLFIFGAFFVHRAHPLFEDLLGRVLTYMLLGSVGLGYLVDVMILMEPNKDRCKLIFILATISFTSIHGSLLVRVATPWIAQLPYIRMSDGSPRYLTPVCRISWFGVIVAIQVTLGVKFSLLDCIQCST
jgi:hypothetical protein